MLYRIRSSKLVDLKLHSWLLCTICDLVLDLTVKIRMRRRRDGIVDKVENWFAAIWYRNAENLTKVGAVIQKLDRRNNGN